MSKESRGCLVDDQREFNVAVDSVAALRRMNPFVIEKDYWETQALRGIVATYDVAFKGGTSLMGVQQWALAWGRLLCRAVGR